MAGYNGYSMSNNAVEAYENNEMPKSKWTKQSIIDEYESVCAAHGFTCYDLSKLTVAMLRSELLTNSSWHHTSSHFNCTDFYKISENACENLTQELINELVSNKVKTAKPISKIETRLVKFLIWSGTRKHPKAAEHIETVEYDCAKNYVMTSFGKKMITSKGFEFIK